jgi:dihydrofolate synthase/folylpolyglutamate synthase
MPSLEEHAAARKFLLDRIDYERMRVMPYGVAEFRLARMRQLLMRLGDPHHGLPAVHVAGTKGKGSTAAALAAVLTAAGYRTGLFTSPHLDRVEERIAIDGRPCSPGQFANLLADIRPVIEALDQRAARRGGGQIGPTYFEILTAMAFVLFARAKIDLAVLEVGLGGRLDATSVCSPVVSVITSISFDHTRQLGHTLAAIAGEKAAIAKRGVPLVSGVTAHEPRAVIRAICRRRRCRLLEQGVDFDFDYRPPRHLEEAEAAGKMDFRWRRRRPAAAHGGYRDLALGLVGPHQAANMAVALAALGQLQHSGWNVPEEAIRRGLAAPAWPARVEVAARRPAVVLDGAHNAASAAALIETLGESFSPARRLLVFASTQEKDLRGMFTCLLGQFDEVLLTRYLDNPRAVPPEELQAVARELTGRQYPVFADPAAAWEAARRWARPEDLVCVTGSLFIAAEMRRQLAARPLAT